MFEDVKLCKDCKYSKKGIYDTQHFCYHPNHGVNLVTGRIYWHSCAFSREYPSQCSQEAKWFEPRQSVVEKVIKFFKKENK